MEDKKIAKVPFNQDINEVIASSFAEQIEERGYIKYRAVEAALRIFMSSSPEEQVRLMSIGNSNQPNQIGEQLSLRETLRRIIESAETVSSGPGQIIKISPSDEKLWTELRKLVDDKPKKQEKLSKA